MRADEVRDVFESVDAQPSTKFSEALLAQLRADYLRADLDASRDTHPLTPEPILLDVLHEEPRVGHGRRPERPNRPWSRHRIAVGAAAAAVIVAAIVFVRTANDDVEVIAPADPGPTATTTPAPSPPTGNTGFVGLPPEGATPSTPPTGELIARWYAHPIAGASFSGARHVYADGRVLSYQVSRDSGWLEQRLTPEGVELVRSEIVSTGLFDADVDLPTAEGGIWVRNGDRPVQIRVPRGSGAGHDLLLRLAALETWLPPSVWEDREAKAYIPSSYAVCVGRADSGEALPDPVQVVSLFPAPLPQLSGSPRRGNDYPPGPMGPGLNNIDCWNVTTEQAREVAAAFDAAGIETGVENRLGLHYRLDVPEPVSTAVDVNVLPVLPEGAPGGIGA
jgi:hypothetical protein